MSSHLALRPLAAQPDPSGSSSVANSSHARSEFATILPGGKALS